MEYANKDKGKGKDKHKIVHTYGEWKVVTGEIKGQLCHM